MGAELVAGSRRWFGPRTSNDHVTHESSESGKIRTLEVVCSAASPANPVENDAAVATIPAGSLILRGVYQVLTAIDVTVGTAAVTDDGISAAATDDSFNHDTAGGFQDLIDAGAAVGRFITVAGFTGEVANNDTWEIVTITDQKIVVDGALTDDAAGESVTITLVPLYSANALNVGLVEPDGTVVDADAFLDVDDTAAGAPTLSDLASPYSPAVDVQVCTVLGDPEMHEWHSGKLRILVDYIPPQG